MCDLCPLFHESPLARLVSLLIQKNKIIKLDNIYFKYDFSSLFRRVKKDFHHFLFLCQLIDSLLVGVLYKDLHELLQSNPSNDDAPTNNK